MTDYDIRKILEERLALVQQRGEKTLRDASHRDSPVSADFAEQAVERENDDVLAAISDESLYEAEQIKIALSRLDNGTYGECKSCGELIDNSRLKAIPYATTCITCAEKEA